jgi:hypothetical protein
MLNYKVDSWQCANITHNYVAWAECMPGEESSAYMCVCKGQHLWRTILHMNAACKLKVMLLNCNFRYKDRIKKCQSVCVLRVHCYVVYVLRSQLHRIEAFHPESKGQLRLNWSDWVELNTKLVPVELKCFGLKCTFSPPCFSAWGFTRIPTSYTRKY